MKTLRISIAVILIAYSGYLLVNMVLVADKLNSFGYGVVLGALVILIAGILLLRFKTKKIK